MGYALRTLGWTMTGALAAMVLYATTAFALACLPVRMPAMAPNAVPDVEAYVMSNGVHTDVVLPVRSDRMDWTKVFRPADFPEMPPDTAFVAVGWGDRDFYLHTQAWRDLTLGRAVRALSGTGQALLHVTWLRRSDLPSKLWHLPLDADGHDAVVRHVIATLQGGQAPARPIPGHHYGPTDAFFEARGAYDLLTTCNTWTGQALRAARVPVSPWTPFAQNVVWRLLAAGPGPSHTKNHTGPPFGFVKHSQSLTTLNDWLAKNPSAFANATINKKGQTLAGRYDDHKTVRHEAPVMARGWKMMSPGLQSRTARECVHRGKANRIHGSHHGIPREPVRRGCRGVHCPV